MSESCDVKTGNCNTTSSASSNCNESCGCGCQESSSCCPIEKATTLWKSAFCQALKEVMTLYYQTNSKGKIDINSLWIDKMINCVRRGAFFNTQRMVEEYRSKMWEKK